MSDNFFGLNPENISSENAEFIKKLSEITEKNITDAFGPPVMTEKEAWQKYQDYCQEQIKKSNPDSKEYRYYMGEIAKCLEEINRD